MPTAAETLFLSVIGGTATGLTGMLLVHFRERWTENRQLVKDVLTEAESVLSGCAELSELVWSNPGGSRKAEEREVVYRLHDISEILQFVNEDGYPVNLYASPALLNFRRAASGRDFDVVGRPPRTEAVLEVRQSAIALKLSFRRLIRSRNSRWI